MYFWKLKNNNTIIISPKVNQIISRKADPIILPKINL